MTRVAETCGRVVQQKRSCTLAILIIVHATRTGEVELHRHRQSCGSQNTGHPSLHQIAESTRIIQPPVVNTTTPQVIRRVSNRHFDGLSVSVTNGPSPGNESHGLNTPHQRAPSCSFSYPHAFSRDHSDHFRYTRTQTATHLLARDSPTAENYQAHTH